MFKKVTETANTTFSLKIGGPAGRGIKASGLLFSKLAARSGYFVFNETGYPSLIRGGHNVMKLNVASGPISASKKSSDLLIAFDQMTIDLHKDELGGSGGIIFDADLGLKTNAVAKNIRLFPVPLGKFAHEAGGEELLSNAVALGATAALFGADLNLLVTLLENEMAGRDEKVISANKLCLESGYKFVKNNFASQITNQLEGRDNPLSKVILDGNEAVALGAIAAGMQFCAIYPMSPISQIIQILALHQEEYQYVYKQPEDEIAAINMAIGASFAGVRSMVATSGGGFCLMTEGYGLAGMTETPVVIINGMRPGPATGLPTWSEQGDLDFVLNAHQGTFPKIVLAPGDASEAFYLTIQAFNLADRYQTPVVILLDKNLCESEQSFAEFDLNIHEFDRGKFLKGKITNYKRYALSDDGISLRTVPGTGNFLLANSYEHDEEGYYTEDPDNRTAQMEKRMKKLETCEKADMPKVQLFGPEKATTTIVSWGSNKGPILEALKSLPEVNFLHLTWLNPMPSEEVYECLSKATKVLGVESNFTGQLCNLISQKTGYQITDKMLRFDGRSFSPEEIVEEVKNL